MSHFISTSCRSESCRICKTPATHKIGEEVPNGKSLWTGHEFTAYVCCEHFRLLMGPAVFCPELAVRAENNEPTPDQITMAILEMINTLILIDGLSDTPFPENVSGAVKRFDRPDIRTSLSRRLYHPERYVTSIQVIHVELQSLLNIVWPKNPGDEHILADEVGVPLPTLKRWLKGKNLPQSAVAEPIVAHLKTKFETANIGPWEKMIAAKYRLHESWLVPSYSGHVCPCCSKLRFYEHYVTDMGVCVFCLAARCQYKGVDGCKESPLFAKI